MTKDEILRKFEDDNEHHFHEVDRKWIMEAMEEYAEQQVKNCRIANVVGQSEQLSCETCIFNTHSWGEDYPCANCCGFDKHQAT